MYVSCSLGEKNTTCWILIVFVEVRVVLGHPRAERRTWIGPRVCGLSCLTFTFNPPPKEEDSQFSQTSSCGTGQGWENSSPPWCPFFRASPAFYWCCLMCWPLTRPADWICTTLLRKVIRKLEISPDLRTGRWTPQVSLHVNHYYTYQMLQLKTVNYTNNGNLK